MRNSSYSLKPILLKLYRCFEHALKICMWFGYNPQMIFFFFFGHFFFQFEQPFFGHFDNESEWTVGTLCAQLLLKFQANSFKPLHVL